jgi:DNA (cytosine-5)-methyltransferase 1
VCKNGFVNTRWGGLSDMKDQHTLIALLDDAVAKAEMADAALLDTPSYDGSAETVRNDIDLLTSDDRVAAPTKVTVVGIAAKLWKPEWDTRQHQKQLGGPMSLRTVDHAVVARHLYTLGLYRTPTEGALTRSLEQKHPYTLDYPGEITPSPLKHAFLRLLNRVNVDYSQPLAETMLRYVLQRLTIHKHAVEALVGSSRASRVLPTTASLKTANDILNDIFTLGSGVSVTPAIAMHTIFSLLRFQGIRLAPLKHHTASDANSDAFGDIEAYKDDAPVIVVEIKHKQIINDTMIQTFTEKTHGIPMRYMLTTKPTKQRVTDENILIGTVGDVAITILHNHFIDPATFLERLREAIMTNEDLGHVSKAAIDEIFTLHLGNASE